MYSVIVLDYKIILHWYKHLVMRIIHNSIAKVQYLGVKYIPIQYEYAFQTSSVFKTYMQPLCQYC